MRRNSHTSNAICTHDGRGIVFDPHYTESALKLLAPKSYRRQKRLLQTRRSVAKQQILLSLLLFGKAYLSQPTWLSQPFLPELNRLIKEDLIGWIPLDHYESAFDHLSILINKLEAKAEWERRPHSNLRDDGRRVRRDHEKYQTRRITIESDLSSEVISDLEELLYVLPLVQGNLRHLRLTLTDPLELLLQPAVQGKPWLFRFFSRSQWDRIFLPEFYLEQALDAEDELDLFDVEEKYREIPDDLAAVLDALASSLAAEHFVASTLLPLQTSGAEGLRIRRTSFAPEAYQLLKIQFHALRYPVIESIEDVLRLRADPHLRTYRSVIAEYSSRLRLDLENERATTLAHFRKDIELALKSLVAVKRWSKVIDLSFYLSLPLVVIGALMGYPLSDALVIPLTSYAKIVSYQKRKQLDWILFGRPT